MVRFILTGMVFLLSACSSGDVRDTLGLDRSAPDEFKVVSRPPLSVPPEFHLRPPRPGEPSLAAQNVEKQAESQLFGNRSSSGGYYGQTSLGDMRPASIDTALDPIVSSSVESAAESNFLKKAGTGNADPKIRELLYEEQKVEPVTQQQASPLERWLGLSDGDPVVDPKAEAERIRTNKDEGKAVNEGEVKTIDPKKDSVIDKLF